MTYNNNIYVGTGNKTNGAQVWRKIGNGAWIQVNSNGFGDTRNVEITAMDVFNYQLYAITRSGDQGAKVYRCSTCDNSDWQEVESADFLNPNNNWDHGLIAVNGKLYVILGNQMTGITVWRTANGQDWTEIAAGGLGNANNYNTALDNAMVALNNELYIGTINTANGGEIWQLLKTIYLPLTIR